MISNLIEVKRVVKVIAQAERVVVVEREAEMAAKWCIGIEHRGDGLRCGLFAAPEVHAWALSYCFEHAKYAVWIRFAFVWKK
ncbi:MAG: hypothetical protein AAF809_01710 [Bacteroidota bacterium]